MSKSAQPSYLALPESAYRVGADGDFVVADAATAPGKHVDSEKALKKRLRQQVQQISKLQRKLYADDRFALLLVFQAMDAAGKDGTIRAVLSGVNPAGCHVSSFKSPSRNEIEHDYLWRTACKLPQRGMIGVFNRSYYEEVLAVKVHSRFLDGQRLPPVDREGIWQERYESIRDHEQHLHRNGTVVLKFWLNVSREQQKQRFLSRLTDPEKHWKFSKNDLSERQHWDSYMDAYQGLLRATSTDMCPWYAIPADNKPYMRCCVADVVLQALQNLPLQYPEQPQEVMDAFASYQQQLDDE